MTRTDDLRARTADDARELIAASFDVSPYTLVEELGELGERKARAEARAFQLEAERPIVLARLATEFSVAHAKENLSEAKLERMARGDNRYATHIVRQAVAIEEREMARSEYWRVKSLLEWDRASVAHLNAMSRLEDPV